MFPTFVMHKIKYQECLLWPWFLNLYHCMSADFEHGLPFCSVKPTFGATPQALSRKKDIRTFQFPVFFAFAAIVDASMNGLGTKNNITNDWIIPWESWNWNYRHGSGWLIHFSGSRHPCCTIDGCWWFQLIYCWARNFQD